jgi:hypothetical protein
VGGPVALRVPPEPRGPRSRRVVLSPAFLAWRPHPPVWRPPPHFPAWLVIAAVFGIQGSSCLVSTPSGLALLCSPGLPPAASAGSLARAHPHSSAPALAIGEREETLGTSNAPTISFPWGPNFDGSFVRSRYGPPGCSPPGLIRPSNGSTCLRLLHPGFQPSSHPEDCRI